jgi:hypothetical protein
MAGWLTAWQISNNDFELVVVITIFANKALNFARANLTTLFYQKPRGNNHNNKTMRLLAY